MANHINADLRMGYHFFDELISTKYNDIGIVIVTHLLPDRPCFIRSIDKLAHVKLIFAKPKSVNEAVLNDLESDYRVLKKERDFFQNPTALLN